MQSKLTGHLLPENAFGGAIFCQAGGKKLSFVPTQAQAIYIYISLDGLNFVDLLGMTPLSLN